MEETVESSNFCVPVGRRLKWSLYFCYAMMIFFTLAMAAFILIQILKYTDSTLNFALLCLGLLAAVSTWISLWFDVTKMQDQTGVRFDPDFLYTFSVMSKIKFPYDIIQEVIFYPALVNISKNKYGHRSWVRLRTKTRSYVLVVPHYSLVMAELQKRKIEVRSNKKMIPLVAFCIIVLSVARLAVIWLVAALILMVMGKGSKNGFASRRSEIIVLLGGLGAAMMIAAAFPLSSAERNRSAVYTAIQQEKHEVATAACQAVSPDETSDYHNACAWYFVTTTDIRWRNYQKAVELATIAVEKANIAGFKGAAADTLACAHAGLGDFPQALKIANDYNLEKRIETFTNQNTCSR